MFKQGDYSYTDIQSYIYISGLEPAELQSLAGLDHYLVTDIAFCLSMIEDSLRSFVIPKTCFWERTLVGRQGRRLEKKTSLYFLA